MTSRSTGPPLGKVFHQEKQLTPSKWQTGWIDLFLNEQKINFVLYFKANHEVDLWPIRPLHNTLHWWRWVQKWLTAQKFSNRKYPSNKDLKSELNFFCWSALNIYLSVYQRFKIRNPSIPVLCIYQNPRNPGPATGKPPIHPLDGVQCARGQGSDKTNQFL